MPVTLLDTGNLVLNAGSSFIPKCSPINYLTLVSQPFHEGGRTVIITPT